MKLSPFGLCVRKLRLEIGTTLKNMADALGVSSAYLSAVELGEKPLTQKLIEETVTYFEPHVNAEMLDEIRSAGAETMVSIPVGGLPGRDRGLVAAFARRLSEGQGIPEDVMRWLNRGSQNGGRNNEEEGTKKA